MGPIVIDIDPVIVDLGPLTFRWYGLAVLAGLLAGLWLAEREAKRKRLPEGLIGDLALWVVPGGLIGARLLHVIDRWPAYLANPAVALAMTEGGLAIQGALLGGLLAGAVALWRRGLKVGPVVDAVAPGLLLGQAVGRLGCLVTGDAVGAPTSLPWAVVYTNPAAMVPQIGVAYQPAFAYEALWDLAALTLLWHLRTRLRPDGAVFALYLVLYGTGKFLVSFARAEVVWIGNLQQAQLVAALLVLAGLAWLLQHRRQFVPIVNV